MSKESNTLQQKKVLSDQERIELATKLDKELDEFISGLEKKAFTDRWKENDKWHKEMENHPFFMKDLPKDGEVSPLIEGLQQLKYSTEENTPEELATSYKEDGNFNFKCKNYRMAVISYTEGLRQNISDLELKAQLYNNRAAAQWQLKNFRSCYNDCKLALKTVPLYSKAQKRLAQACFELGLFDECIDHCDTLLHNEVDEQLSALRTKAFTEKKIKDRDRRKEYVQRKKEDIKKEKLKKMIEERGIKFVSKPCWEITDPAIPQEVQVEDDRLVWPVVILYPEYKTSDIIEHFHEDSTFEEHFQLMFEEHPEWDINKKYSPKSVVIHYEDLNGSIHPVRKTSTLGSVLKETGFRVDGNTPSFIVLARDSEAYKRFMENY